jgi:hypothetical protein
MKEQLENALSTLIIKATSGAEKMSDFLVDEIPEVLTQLLMWHGISSLVYFILSLTIMILIYPITSKLWKEIIRLDEGGCTDAAIGLSLFSIGSAICLFIFLSKITNLTWLKIWLAPKVWLIEYAATLVK